MKIIENIKNLWRKRGIERINPVSLNDFIQRALVSLAEGIERAEKELIEKNLNSVINPRWYKPIAGGSHPLPKEGQREIKFKVLVEVSADTKTQGQINVVTGIVNLNSEGNTIKQSKQTSELEFSVPIVLSFSERESNFNQKNK